jgi:hypothetical protein
VSLERDLPGDRLEAPDMCYSALMPVSTKLEQPADEIVSLRGWELGNEFPYGPQGAKPKKIVICPNPSPHSFLMGGHLFIARSSGQ